MRLQNPEDHSGNWELHFLLMGKQFGSVPADCSSEREPCSGFRDTFFTASELYLLTLQRAFWTSVQTLMFGSIFSHFILSLPPPLHAQVPEGSGGRWSVPQCLSLLWTRGAGGGGRVHCAFGLLSWFLELARILFGFLDLLVCLQWLL